MDTLLQKIVDGEYKIHPDIAGAMDGGTIGFKVSNATGDTYDLYLDRRINTDTPDVFYQNEYPGSNGSIQLGKNDALVAKVEAAFK